MKKVNESLTAPTKKDRSILESAGHIAAQSAGHIAALAAKQVNRGINIAGRGVNIAGSAAESINKFVLPINEVGRIATGKGTKGDYASTALKVAPFIGGAVKGVRMAKEAERMGKWIQGEKVRDEFIRETERVNSALRAKKTGDSYLQRSFAEKSPRRP